jgi:hypothetical protein
MGGMPRMRYLAALLLLLTGCASDVVLPTAQVNTADFTVTTLPNHAFLITYKGPAQTPHQRVLDLALLKASQLARQQDFKYFVIVDAVESKPGEMKYRRTLPEPSEFNNELMVQAFKARPERTFCFLAEETERAIYEKLRTAEEAETL